MSKIKCTCGNILLDQTDYLRFKALLIADQDVETCLHTPHSVEKLLTAFNQCAFKAFQCDICGSLMIIKNGERFNFLPHKHSNNNVLESKNGKSWKGILRGFYDTNRGEVFWQSNRTSGFEQDLSKDEVAALYNKIYKRLTHLNILNNSSLVVNGEIEHIFEDESG